VFIPFVKSYNRVCHKIRLRHVPMVPYSNIWNNLQLLRRMESVDITQFNYDILANTILQKTKEWYFHCLFLHFSTFFTFSAWNTCSYFASNLPLLISRLFFQTELLRIKFFFTSPFKTKQNFYCIPKIVFTHIFSFSYIFFCH